jgi:DNA-binding Xre family transcriptional regulator
MIRLTVKEYLDEHGITRYELAKRSGISFQVVDKYYKNKVVRYDSYLLEKFCDALGCGIADLIEYQPDEKK